MKSKKSLGALRLLALSEALREDKIQLVLVQHAVSGLWDLSALHVNAGVLSSLMADSRGAGGSCVLVNGKLVGAPKSGMARRVKR